MMGRWKFCAKCAAKQRSRYKTNPNMNKPNPNKLCTLSQCFPRFFSFKKITHVRWNMAHETNEHHDGKTYYIWVQCKWFASIFKHNKIIHVNQLCCYCFLNCIHFWAISKFWLCVCMCTLPRRKWDERVFSPKETSSEPNRTSSNACTKLHANCE